VRRSAWLTGRLEALARRPYRNALVIIAIAVVMAALFAASYSLALGRATPHHITVGLVGRPAQRPALIGALERATLGALTFRPYGSAAAAQQAIAQQATYAALVPGPGRPQLLISSASGASVARVLEHAAEAAQGAGQPVRVVDLHPLPPADPQGLISFYVTLAASFVGFVTITSAEPAGVGGDPVSDAFGCSKVDDLLPDGSRTWARSGIVTEYAMRPARGSAGDHLESLPPRCEPLLALDPPGVGRAGDELAEPGVPAGSRCLVYHAKHAIVGFGGQRRRDDRDRPGPPGRGSRPAKPGPPV
jgi:hypothetical protein